VRSKLRSIAIVLSVASLFAISNAAVASASCASAGEEVKSLSRDATRTALECLFNGKRVNRGGLNHSDQLEEAAQKHTNTMRSMQCFSHDCPGEPNLTTRVRRTGYLSGARDPELGEILKYAADEITPQQMVNEWMRSAEHRSLIMRHTFEDVGVGISVKDNSILATAVLGHK
jgi:uncharacterized protein YkwD